VYALLLVHPEGAKERDGGGRLPLHLAAGAGAGTGILSALVRFYAEGIIVKEGRGLIPLHLALSRGGREIGFGFSEGVDDNDDNEEDDMLSLEMLRVLLGQRLYSSRDLKTNARRKVSRGRNSSHARKVRDGDLRRGGHLELKLDEIGTGMFGENFNSTLEKKRRRRDSEAILREERNGTTTATKIVNIPESCEDENLQRDEFLASLWEERRGPGMVGSISKVRTFGNAEIDEAETFSMDVQNCLRRLAQWRKRHRKIDGIDATFSGEKEENEEVWDKWNPAAIAAPPHMRLPIHMAIRMNHHQDRRRLGQNPYPLATSMKCHSNQNEILRVLIHAHPPSLLEQDLQGRTPLMTCLQLSHHPARFQMDFEMTELLLGIRTVGFRTAPQWRDGDNLIITHNHCHQRREARLGDNDEDGRGISGGTSRRTHNPAMIPMNQTLPLHVAARESLASSIVHAIFSCYPRARYVQDESRCTPLHCSLKNITGSSFLNLEIIELLMDERVVRMKDDLNQSVMDLLVINANSGRIPLSIDRGECYHRKQTLSLYRGSTQSTFKRIQMYQMVFHYHLLDNNDDTSSSLSTCFEEEFLSKLRVLPPWLRRLACLTPTFQHMLLRELIKPGCMAMIMLYGIVLLTLTTVFAYMVDEHASSYHFNNVRGMESTSTTGTYKTVIIIALIYLAIHEFSFFGACLRLHVVSTQYFGNVWSWVTAGALVTTTVATMLLHRRYQWDAVEENNSSSSVQKDDSTLTLSAITIGLLTLMFFGYLSRWMYVVNVFCSSVIKIAKALLPSFLICTILVLSFMRMLYFIFGQDEQCVSPIDTAERVYVCSVWDTFEMMYLFIIGESFFARDSDVNDDKSPTAVVLLICAFVTLLFLFFLQMVSISIESTTSSKMGETKVDMFWAPLLTYVFLVRDLRVMLCCKGGDVSINTKPYQKLCPSLEQQLESIWEYFCVLYSNVDLRDTKWWYLEERKNISTLFAKKWVIRLIGLVIIPLWLSLGFFTLGILWPPQVRWWILIWASHPFKDILNNDAGQQYLEIDDHAGLSELSQTFPSSSR